MKAYLDNGATTMVAKEVADAMLPYFTEDYGNASSLHSYGRKARKALEESRKAIAKAINAGPDEIIFTSGGTESDNLAIKGYAYANRNKGNHIITSKIEHPAVLRCCEALEKQGFEISYIGVDKEGFINIEELKKAIKKETILVSIMHANNEIGTIEPIGKIAGLCKENNIAFHSDAVQSFTKIAIDVKKLGISLMSLSAHKIHGPKGIGALYVRKGIKLEKQMHGGSHELKLRAGTENVASAVGFAKAVELAKKEHIAAMTELRDYMIGELKKNISDIIINGPEKDKRLCNNINVSFRFIEGEALLLSLDFEGIAVSTGSACSSKSLEPSHVLLAIGLKPETAHGSIRITLSRYTTKEEISYCVEKLRHYVEKLRKISPLRK